MTKSAPSVLDYIERGAADVVAALYAGKRLERSG